MDQCVIRMRRERLKRLWKPVFHLAVMAAIAWWLADMASEQYRWQWYRVWRYVGTWEDGVFSPGVLLEALGVTLRLTAASLALALGVGAVLAAMKLSASPVARLLASAAVGALRNTPLLMQLFISTLCSIQFFLLISNQDVVCRNLFIDISCLSC